MRKLRHRETSALPKVTELGDSTAGIATQVLVISQSSLDQPAEKNQNREAKERKERPALLPQDRKATKERAEAAQKL